MLHAAGGLVSAWLLLAALVGMAVVRAPFVRRSVRVAVEQSHETRLDRALVVLVALGMLAAIAWLTGGLAFADRDQKLWCTLAGVGGVLIGLGLLHRSHRDLGVNWSNTLVLRCGHALVTGGIYRHVRHPMYAALLAYGLGLTLLVPNWIAGPAFLVPFAMLVASRLAAEERMLQGRFGAAWDAYAARSWRLLPWIW